jgi:hypothetical protein
MRVWSFSSMNTYYTCPRMYDLQYNKKVIPYQETEATKYGTRVHEALEHYARDGKDLPDDCLKFKKYVDKVMSLPGEKFFEREFALTRNLEPCSFDDTSAWCRGVVDIGAVGGEKALLADWKTGKVRHDSDQLKLFAGFTMQTYKQVETVKTTYAWLVHGKTTSETYKKGDLPDIWQHFIAKANKLEDSYQKDKWVPKTSGLCAGWCGAGRDNCDFWSPRRK